MAWPYLMKGYVMTIRGIIATLVQLESAMQDLIERKEARLDVLSETSPQAETLQDEIDALGEASESVTTAKDALEALD